MLCSKRCVSIREVLDFLDSHPELVNLTFKDLASVGARRAAQIVAITSGNISSDDLKGQFLCSHTDSNRNRLKQYAKPRLS